MKRLIKTIMYAAMSVVATAVFTGCPPNCDLQPPLVNVDHETAVKASAAVNAVSTAISGASGSIDISRTVKDTYATVNQDDIAFIILIKAADCESRRKNFAAAQQLRDMAGAELARRHPGVATAHGMAKKKTPPNALTPVEEKVFAKSPIKEQIRASVSALKLQ
jgi:hypothetical protein